MTTRQFVKKIPEECARCNGKATHMRLYEKFGAALIGWNVVRLHEFLCKTHAKESELDFTKWLEGL